MSTTKYQVSLDLLKKYDRPGPRYTSYPTAPHFHSDFDPAAYEEEIRRTNEADNPPDVSLYFHFPFCKTLCYYCACNVIITHNPRRIEEYLYLLKKEIDLLSAKLNPSRKVIQLHWGGGTPTYLSPEQIRDIFLYIREKFNFAPDAEISLEVDPRRLTEEYLPTLRRLGFNRISFGVQDFNMEVQEAVNRIQPEALTRKVVTESRALGFDSINVDLICGLPHQTLSSYKETVTKIIDINPDRLAVFNYAHVPWLKKHQRIIPDTALPKGEEKLAILKMVIERLTEAGYVYIGMDHFARPDDELTVALQNHSLHRNFQGYTTRAGAEVYALGVTGISQLERAYAQNVKDTKEYSERLLSGRLPTSLGCRLNDDDVLRRYVINELMCNNRLIKAEIEKKFGIDFDGYFREAIGQLQEFVADGLLQMTADRIEVTGSGRLVIRNMAMAFDAYLKTDQQKDSPLYSRTV